MSRSPYKALRIARTHLDFQSRNDELERITGGTSWHHTHIANGLLEGTNSLIQAAKARARGYRTKDKMITIIYLIAAKLPLPTRSQPLLATHTM